MTKTKEGQKSTSNARGRKRRLEKGQAVYHDGQKGFESPNPNLSEHRKRNLTRTLGIKMGTTGPQPGQGKEKDEGKKKKQNVSSLSRGDASRKTSPTISRDRVEPFFGPNSTSILGRGALTGKQFSAPSSSSPIMTLSRTSVRGLPKCRGHGSNDP